MFATVLIANRGEIACRIIRTARRMGLRSVAVYSDADAASQHVSLADLAIRIGPPAPRDSYLRADAILEAARQSGAEAVHPGYGFLSENADFAEAVAAAGLVFVGPPASAIRAMGGKSQSKALMQQAGVPVVPGYHGADQDPATLIAAAADIGYPVLIKASAGGGGKGMRVVTDPADLPDALAAAAREGQSSFGDPRLLLERYLPRPRHVEVQILADTHGATLALFDRDCSVQRRHQKVIEEAPAPFLSDDLRARMRDAAVAAARAVGYVGAGTVEFIVAEADFAFMEMNTRLQVEHPVTEAITGLDLVEWQLRIAAGAALPWRQSDLACRGHAVEARLYAEDPAADFRPSTGLLAHLRLPADLPQRDGVRVDAGVRAGDRITADYDPMIAKIIAHGADRPEALRRLAAALAETEVVGPRTNLRFARNVLTHPAFIAGAIDTGFIARHADALLAEPAATPPVIAAAALAAIARPVSSDPWDAADGWRLNLPASRNIHLRGAAGDLTIAVTPDGLDRYGLTWDGSTHRVAGMPGGTVCDGVTHRLGVHVTAEAITVLHDAATHRFALRDPLAPPQQEAAAGLLAAPIPGRVVAILVGLGESVRKGQKLVVVEAMKMELSLTAATDGTVAELRCAVGERVEEGVELVRVAPRDAAPHDAMTANSVE